MTRLKQCQDKREWDDYVLEHGGHPLQLWGWGDLKEANGWKATRLFLFDEEEKKTGAVQVLIRGLPWPMNSLAYVPRGPVVDEQGREELLNELADYVKKNFHSVALTIEPDELEYSVSEGWKKSDGYILPSKTIILDLKHPESKLMMNMAKKTRQYIRKSAADSIDIRVVKTKAELTGCIEVYKDTAGRARFDLHKDEYYYDVFDKLGDHSLVFAAYSDEKPVAFLWVALSTATSFELYGGMTEEGATLRANYALKWYAIRKCKEWGINRYDFGGLIDGGVKNFKMGWTDNETELAGTFDKPLSIFYGLWNSTLPVAKKVIRKLKSPFRRK